MRSLSAQGCAASHAAAAIVSSYGLVAQSLEIASAKAWPNPDDPWKLCHAVT